MSGAVNGMGNGGWSALVSGLVMSLALLHASPGVADMALLDRQDVLTLPSVTVGESTYAVSLRMLSLEGRLVFELTGVHGLVKSDLPSSRYADGHLTIDNVVYGNNVYSASLRLLEGSEPLRFVLETASEVCSDCAEGDETATGPFLLSPAFADGRPMGARYGCSGASLSPPLTWTPGPAGTLSYALIMEDQQASGTRFGQPWVHWNLFNIPNSNRCLLRLLVTL